LKTSTRILSISAAVLTLGAGGFAFAQASNEGRDCMGGGMGMQQGMGKHGGAHGGTHGGMGGGMGGGMRGAGPADVAARLAATKAELKITAAQETAWQAYEAVVRQQAESRQAMRTAMQARMQDPAAAASVDHAAMRETMHQQRESNQAARDQARQALYAVLSPEQKAVADQRLHFGPGHRKGAHHHAG
jgi:Spy/CpxP family protein refolding chaperone